MATLLVKRHQLRGNIIEGLHYGSQLSEQADLHGAQLPSTRSFERTILMRGQGVTAASQNLKVA